MSGDIVYFLLHCFATTFIVITIFIFSKAMAVANSIHPLATLLVTQGQELYLTETLKLVEVPGGFVNLTAYKIGGQAAAILSYGPKFLVPASMNILDYVEDLSRLNMYMQRKYGPMDFSQIYLRIFDEQREGFAEVFSKKELSLTEQTLRQAFQEVQTFFRTHNNVCIVQSDKGNRTCLMLCTDYEQKMQAYMQGCISRGVYAEASSGLRRSASSAFQTLLDQFKRELAEGFQSRIDAKIVSGLLSFRNGTISLPMLYGTVKGHKPDTPMRPICSTLHWYSKPVQKLLLFVLESYFDDYLCPQNITNTDTLALDLSKLVTVPDNIFVKMDVSDMYGSMDKGKIFTTIKKLLQHPSIEAKKLFSAEFVCRMLHYSLEVSCLLSYGDRTYKQVQGLPQGACDSGYLATLYLDSLLQVHFEELFTVHRVARFWKYMDDILLYMPRQFVLPFKEAFEFITGLGLEVEYEELPDSPHLAELGIVSTISFWDVNIGRSASGMIHTSCYRKPTSSLRMIHALSSTILSYKLNAIRGALTKIFRRTSTALLSHDMHNFYNQCLENGYPPYLLDGIFDEEIRVEVKTLEAGNCYMLILNYQLKERITLLNDTANSLGYSGQKIVQRLRAHHVALSTSPHCVFPYRSIGFSNIMRLACHIGGVSMPTYSRGNPCLLLTQFFANRRLRALAEEPEPLHKAAFNIGVVRCTNCKMFFVISGRYRLRKMVETELAREGSD